MIGVILTGHGSFATGLHEAAIQIVGKQEQFQAVNFPDGASTEALEQQLRDAVKVCDKGDGVIFLTDLLGGSPFRTASLISFELTQAEVITGTNMQLLLELLLEREDLTPQEARDVMIESARIGITSFWHENQKKSSQTEVCDDGI